MMAKMFNKLLPSGGSPHKRRCPYDFCVPPYKQVKTPYPAYFIPELAHVVALCDEKIPFLNLSRCLSKLDVLHCGLRVESFSMTLIIPILMLPKPTPPEGTKVNYTHTYLLYGHSTRLN